MKIKIDIIKGSSKFKSYVKNKIKFNQIDNLFANPEFLEYHKKIECFYLVIEVDKNIVSYLPFTRNNNSLLSHGGGTYGGFIQIQDLNNIEINEIETELIKFLSKKKIDILTIRFLPELFWNNYTSLNSHFISNMDSLFYEEEFYLRLGEDLNKLEDLNFRRNHKRDIKKFLLSDFNFMLCKSDSDVSEFYKILENNLIKHKVTPTHSIDELIYLFNNNSEKISISLIKSKENYLAGLTLFEINSSTDYVMYGSMNYNSDSAGALKYLYWQIAMKSYYSGKKYLSLGINSKHNEPKNSALESFKVGLGAEVVNRHTKVLKIN